jgi:hypothetical protein
MLEKAKVTQNLAYLLRGFFAAPIISFLGRYGDIMRSSPESTFSASDFSNIKDRESLEMCFQYLVNIGLMTDDQTGRYGLTAAGWEVFRRANSFFVPHSYSAHMANLDKILLGVKDVKTMPVDRLENVIGSGITHLRYFPPAISYIRRECKAEVLVDIGCGDGGFLREVAKGTSIKSLFGVDLSEISTAETKKSLGEQGYSDLSVATYTCDARNVSEWSEPVKKFVGGRRAVISMWFLLHEISGGEKSVLVEFLRRVEEHFPGVDIIVGEVVRQSGDILRHNAINSLMPEYLFFHDLSRQGILSWKQYQSVIEETRYQIKFQRLFDEQRSCENEEREPSTLLWVLSDNKELQ